VIRAADFGAVSIAGRSEPFAHRHGSDQAGRDGDPSVDFNPRTSTPLWEEPLMSPQIDNLLRVE
jgi:hypothetical protein